MHKHITHNKCYETFAGFKTAVLTFLREEVPKKWHIYCDTVTDNFRVIDPKDFRVLARTGYISTRPSVRECHVASSCSRRAASILSTSSPAALPITSPCPSWLRRLVAAPR